MSEYVSVRGWLESDQSDVKLLNEKLTLYQSKADDYCLTQEQCDLYLGAWVFQDNPVNWTHYIFYGADIKSYAVPLIKDFIRDMCSSAEDLSGFFKVDNEQGESKQWVIDGGVFTE